MMVMVMVMGMVKILMDNSGEGCEGARKDYYDTLVVTK